MESNQGKLHANAGLPSPSSDERLRGNAESVWSAITRFSPHAATFSSQTRGAIRRALPCFGERALPEGDDDGRSSAEMVGSGRECLDQYSCELSRDCNRRPSASGAVSDAAPQMGSGNPGTPVGSSLPAAHRRHSHWAPNTRHVQMEVKQRRRASTRRISVSNAGSAPPECPC